MGGVSTMVDTIFYEDFRVVEKAAGIFSGCGHLDGHYCPRPTQPQT